MRRIEEIDPVMVQAFLDQLDFFNLTHKGDYAAFAQQYLTREHKGVRGGVIFDRYRALEEI